MKITQQISKCLADNNNKLSPQFINELVEAGTTDYHQLTPTMRICIITLESGHEVYGVAQVLDSSNDVEEIGNKVAYDNAVSELWSTVGSIAKALI